MIKRYFYQIKLIQKDFRLYLKIHLTKSFLILHHYLFNPIFLSDLIMNHLIFSFLKKYLAFLFLKLSFLQILMLHIKFRSSLIRLQFSFITFLSKSILFIDCFILLDTKLNIFIHF